MTASHLDAPFQARENVGQWQDWGLRSITAAKRSIKASRPALSEAGKLMTAYVQVFGRRQWQGSPRVRAAGVGKPPRHDADLPVPLNELV
jgi:hypothetical protein